MTGLYPDHPNNRLAYEHINAKWYDGSGPTEQDISYSYSTNSNNFAWNWAFYGIAPNRNSFLLFPFKIDITHLHISGYRIGTTQWSSDTTNGIDGTWTGLSVPIYGASNASARQNIYPISLPACRAFWMYQDPAASQYTYIQAVHVYGTPTAGQNPDRIELWHPTLDQRVPPAHFDWGDVPRTTSGDKTFRIKNLSDVLTVNNIVVTAETYTDSSPSYAATHLFSTGGSFTASITIPTLAPGQISSVLTVRKATPSNAQLSLWTAKILATPTSWT